MDTITIKVYDRAGDPHDIAAPTGMSLNVMEVCRSSGLEVEGTCGGMALCASCHCYLESEHPALLTRSEAEEDMLDQAFYVEPTSRLGCQIPIEAQADGLVVRLAPV